MSRFVKPWLLALTVALCLHGLLFVWLKDRHWGVTIPTDDAPHLEVSLLPDAEKMPSEATTDSTAPAVPSATQPSTPAPQSQPSQSNTTTSAPSRAATQQDVSAQQATPMKPSSTASDSVSKTPRRAVSLAEIQQLQSTVDQAPQDWKQGSLLDIGPTQVNKKQLDSAKAAFSPDFRQALKEAKSLQSEYAKGVVEKHDYPITEDPDGTRYVNIKGVCWKLPEPGSYAEWQVVLSGCSGQKDTFRFELNITTDILRSDMFHELPFTMPE